MLGCSACYEAFRDLLVPELRRFHGDTRHIGRKPGGGYQIPDQADAPARPAPAVEKAQPADEAAQAGPSEAAGEGFEKAPAVQEPAKAADPKERIRRLRRLIRDAIEREDYKAAAQYRDQIQRLEADHEGTSGDA